MIIKTNVKNFKKDFKKIVKAAYEDKRKESIIPKVRIAIKMLKEEIENVINQYNTGEIERYSGDYEKRLRDNSSYGRNMPLKLSGDYYKDIDTELPGGVLDEIIGKVFSDTKYAEIIELGNTLPGINNNYEPYRVFEIALRNIKTDIIKLFKE